MADSECTAVITIRKANNELYDIHVPQDVKDYVLSDQLDKPTQRALIKQLMESQTVSKVRHEPETPPPSETSGFPDSACATPGPSSMQLGELPASETPNPVTRKPITRRFTPDEVKIIITERIKMEEKFASGQVRHEKLWSQIQDVLAREGYTRTNTQISGKWTELKGKYREAKDNNGQTGRGRQDFVYMAEFNDYMGERAATKPQFTVDSHPTVEDAEAEVAVGNDDDSATGGKEPKEKKRKFSALAEIAKEAGELRAVVKENHAEKMGMFREFLNVFKQSVDK